ncbi:rhodanese-like domain-containing protein [Flavihumibacter sediminis]|nr:rhodanese-like domain-containing protein [Flavihumibacter sediminis]
MITQLSPGELRDLLGKGEKILLIDVREEEEHEAFNIGGMLLPIGEIIQKADGIPRSGKVVLYCKRGIRSAIAIQRLQEKFGFTNLINLRGGLEEWKK